MRFQRSLAGIGMTPVSFCLIVCGDSLEGQVVNSLRNRNLWTMYFTATCIILCTRTRIILGVHRLRARSAFRFAGPPWTNGVQPDSFWRSVIPSMAVRLVDYRNNSNNLDHPIIRTPPFSRKNYYCIPSIRYSNIRTPTPSGARTGSPNV